MRNRLRDGSNCPRLGDAEFQSQGQNPGHQSVLSLSIKSSYSVKGTFPSVFWSPLNKIDKGKCVKHLLLSDDGGSTLLIAILLVGWLYFQARREWESDVLNPRNRCRLGFQGLGMADRRARATRGLPQHRADKATVQTFATLSPNPPPDADFPNWEYSYECCGCACPSWF